MAETYKIPTIDDYTKQKYLDKVTADLKAAIAGFETSSATLGPKSITGDMLADGSVDTINIKNASIIAAHIQEGAIGNAQIGAAAIQTANIGNAVIDSIHVKSGSIQNIHIVDGTIDNTKIANATITGAKIANATITSALIGDAQITSAKIGNAQITQAHLGQAVIDTANIKQGAIDSAAIKAGAVDTISIANAAITTALISDLAVTSAKIKDIIADKIVSGTLSTSSVTISGVGGHLKITGNRLQVFDNQTVPVERVSVGDVNSDGTLYGLRVRGTDGTTVLYDENGVYNEGITDGAITNRKIQDDSVDNRILTVNAVIAENIMAGSITGDRIAAATILGTNIAGNTITANKLVTNTITANSGIIADLAITNAKIADAAITTAKIGDAQITNAKIGTLDAGKITTGTINADLVTVSNGKVTIDSSGVTVTNANFMVKDANSGTVNSIIPNTNLIVDHSFELLQVAAMTSTNNVFNIKNTSNDVWYRWAQVGTPLIYNTNEGQSYAPFGLTAALCSSSSYMQQAFHVEPGKSYTLSFTNKYPPTTGIGNPKASIMWYYSNGTTDTLFSQSAIQFYNPANDGTEERNAITATCPTNMPAGYTYYGMVKLYSDGTGWALFDGVQVVKSNVAAPYNPEDEVWRMRRGTDKYAAQLSVDTVDPHGVPFNILGGMPQIDGAYMIITSTNANGSYIKFSNGVLICWLDITVTDQAMSAAYGSLFQGTRSWTFPTAFASSPSVACTNFKWGTGAGWGATNGTASATTGFLRGFDVSSRASGTSVYISAIAIGRW